MRTSIRRFRPCARPVHETMTPCPSPRTHFLLFILETTFQGTGDKHDLYTTRMCKHELRRNVIGALRSRCDKSACVYTPLRVTNAVNAIASHCCYDAPETWTDLRRKQKPETTIDVAYSIRVSSTCPVRHIFMLF